MESAINKFSIFNKFPFLGKVKLKYIEHHLVDHCNLNCAGCTHFSPLAEPWFEDLEDFKRDFMQLSKMFNIETVRLMGGEPLLHPQIKEFITYARQMFPLAHIEVVTNGILLKQDKSLIDVINYNNITVGVSDYGVIKDFDAQLVGINSVKRFGKAKMYNPCLDLTCGQDPEYTHANCIHRVNSCNYFQNGRFYACATSANVDKFNKFFGKNLPTEEGISIYEHSPREVYDYLCNKIVGLCACCNIDEAAKSYRPFYRSDNDIKEWTK